MWFGTLILKNVVRRPLRSALTVIAIAIAICAVVSLVGIARGFQQSLADLYERVGVDLIVVRSGGRQRLNSALDARLGDKIRALPGVKDVLPGLVDVLSFSDYGIYSVILQGWVPETAAFEHLKMESGRMLTRKDRKAVMLGTLLAKNLGKKVGDTIDLLEDEQFTIVGIYESFNVYENGAMIIPLDQLQRIMDRPNQVTGFSLILTEEGRRHLPRVRQEVEALARNISAMPTKEHVDSLQEIRLGKAMAFLTSAIALVIGLFGVMNTMVMAVHERTQEIGILRAVGWRPGRVLRLVLYEAVALSLIGAFLGTVGSIILVRLLQFVPTANVLIAGRIQPDLILYGFLIAAGVGLVGGILPARRASRMLPTAALRQE
jgi:putative ABC transport system permease protein